MTSFSESLNDKPKEGEATEGNHAARGASVTHSTAMSKQRSDR